MQVSPDSGAGRNGYKRTAPSLTFNADRSEGPCVRLDEQSQHNQYDGSGGRDGNSEKQISSAYQRPANFGTHLLSPMLTSRDCK
jgi:hypothetical protein